MSKTSREHTMTVPNWIWEWACNCYKKNNPASELRNMLSERVAEIKSLVKQDEAARAKDSTNKKVRSVTGRKQYYHIDCYDQNFDAIVRDEDDDRGSPFTPTRTAICDWCGRPIREGEEAIIRSR